MFIFGKSAQSHQNSNMIGGSTRDLKNFANIISIAKSEYLNRKESREKFSKRKILGIFTNSISYFASKVSPIKRLT